MALSLKEDIQPMSYVKAHFSEIIAGMAKKHRPMVVTQNGRAASVLVDIDSWERMQRKVAMLVAVNEAEESIARDGVLPFEESMMALAKKYDL